MSQPNLGDLAVTLDTRQDPTWNNAMKRMLHESHIDAPYLAGQEPTERSRQSSTRSDLLFEKLRQVFPAEKQEPGRL